MALSESALSELLVALTDRERGVDLVRELAQWLAQELIEVQATQAIGGVIYFPLLLVSTLFVPKRAYPGWLQPIVENQPLSRVTEAMRAVSTDAATVATNTGQPVNTTHAVLIALAWCAGSVVIFGALAPRVFGRTA